MVVILLILGCYVKGLAEGKSGPSAAGYWCEKADPLALQSRRVVWGLVETCWAGARHFKWEILHCVQDDRPGVGWCGRWGQGGWLKGKSLQLNSFLHFVPETVWEGLNGSARHLDGMRA